MKSVYFDVLQQRIRDIRASQRSATEKIIEVVAESLDYDSKKLPAIIHRLVSVLCTKRNLERFANYLLYTVEAKTLGWKAAGNKEKAYGAWVMNDVERMAREFVIYNIYNRIPDDDQVFYYPSFNGMWVEYQGGEGPDSTVLLPQELKNYEHNYAVLRVIGMNRLIEACSDRRIGRTRPYDILAKLDHEVVDGMPGGVFSANPIIFGDDNENGYSFEFSHFEVDLEEPDPKYRTLYVVFRYITILS